MYSVNVNKLPIAYLNFDFSFYVLIALIMISHAARGVDYCSLCEHHIGCNNSGSFGANCSSDRAVLKMNAAHKEYILKLHNRMRNELALGNIANYSSAVKMPYMQWSNELAYLAELNARSCEYGHDRCRATEKFPWAGQNIARRGNTKGYEKINNAIKHMVTDWFTEYKDANMDYIDKYRDHDEGKKIGHFTVIANDKNSRLGCALNRFQHRGYKYYYFVCDYSFTNIYDQAVYEKGPSASNCLRPHPVYKGLCSADQPVNPIPG